MKSLLYIEAVNELNYTYQKEFIREIKRACEGIEVFDLDNHSGADLFTYAAELLKNSDRCAVILKTDPGAFPGKTVLLLEEILNNRDTVFLLLLGENPYAEKLSNKLRHFARLRSPDEIAPLVIDYFKTSQ